MRFSLVFAAVALMGLCVMPGEALARGASQAGQVKVHGYTNKNGVVVHSYLRTVNSQGSGSNGRETQPSHRNSGRNR
jgi:hypothetical protein